MEKTLFSISVYIDKTDVMGEDTGGTVYLRFAQYAESSVEIAGLIRDALTKGGYNVSTASNVEAFDKRGGTE